MIRRLVAGLIVVGLAVGIWALWPRGDSDTTPTTLPVAVDTTLDSTTLAPTTTSPPETTTTSAGHVVTSVEEAEAILRQLWFGWFEGIYNQDEERIREVVGTQAMLDSARSQFGVMEFQAAPDPTSIAISDLEILRSDQGCLALWAGLSASFRPGASEGVQVLRLFDDRWVFVGLWTYKEDLWEADCESQLESSF
ncbi:MAG TPA: hypothetical protein VLS86_08385 [Acidimicrobiia bacterium]|nr:hypothetical protein [Acidimicrobiia bacterium]